MRDVIVLLIHLVTTVFRLAGPGGLRSVVAEFVLIRHQLLIVTRARRRAPSLRFDCLIAGLCSLWICLAKVRNRPVKISRKVLRNTFPAADLFSVLLEPVISQEAPKETNHRS